MSVRQTGVVAKWLNHKGIGFITPDTAGEDTADILVHFSQIQQETKDGFKSLEKGSKVEYDLVADPKNDDKFIAETVTGPDGADCIAKVKKEPSLEAASGEKKPKSKKGKGKGKKGKGKGKKSKKDGEAKEGAEEATEAEEEKAAEEKTTESSE